LSKPVGWKLSAEEITSARIESDAAMIRMLKPELSKAEGAAVAKLMLEKAVELQRLLERAELNECVRLEVEATARKSVVEIEPGPVEYDT
jgi:hypothetical protein